MTATRTRVKRATVRIRRAAATKVFVDPADAAREADFYRRFPWACPRLLDHDGAVLTIEALPTAPRLPQWRPVDALRDLLTELHAHGVHHRDVHLGNLVRGPHGPLLIDWETAIDHPSALSYDLHGPQASGVPVPIIHAGMHPQWWASPQRMSIRSQWGA